MHTPFRIGFVTDEAHPEVVFDDLFLARELELSGFEVVPYVWDAEEQPECDLLLVRACWDYHRKIDAFRAWLDVTEREGPPLLNSPELVRWNLNKKYLMDLRNAGVGVIPFRWQIAGEYALLEELMEAGKWAAAVVKPMISCNADDTFKLENRAAARAFQARFEEMTKERDFLVQEFMPEIVSEGEWSLTFIDGAYTHAVLKRPAAGDYRIQCSYGGDIVSASPPAPLLAQAQRAVNEIPGDWLYARVDGVRRGDELLIMEVEVFEPTLYFRACPTSAFRMASAIRGRILKM